MLPGCSGRSLSTTGQPSGWQVAGARANNCAREDAQVRARAHVTRVGRQAMRRLGGGNHTDN
eukprot:5018155-Alexandrium_andersonii.AAC.1